MPENNSDGYYNDYLKTIVMDIDDTISFTTEHNNVNAYANAKPNTQLIKVMQKMSNKGYKFVLHTARGYISCNHDVKAADAKYRIQIENWLSKYKVPYEELVFGKPYSAIAYVDDKAMRPDEFINSYNTI